MTMWFVCGMDEGVLRRESSRKAAVAWLLDHHHTDRVLSRHKYARGDYQYQVGGMDGDDRHMAWILRTERMSPAGWDPDQAPLYPLDPPRDHKYVARPVESDRVQDSFDEEDEEAVVVPLPHPVDAVVTEDEALAELRAAHAEMEELTERLAQVRQRRREAGERLRDDFGRGPSWIARQLGVSPQAVDAFLKYKERKEKAG